MKRSILIAASAALIGLSIAAAVAPAAARSRSVVAHPDCNVTMPCEGVSVSPRGERIARAVGFGAAQKVYRVRESRSRASGLVCPAFSETRQHSGCVSRHDRGLRRQTYAYRGHPADVASCRGQGRRRAGAVQMHLPPAARLAGRLFDRRRAHAARPHQLRRRGRPGDGARFPSRRSATCSSEKFRQRSAALKSAVRTPKSAPDGIRQSERRIGVIYELFV